MSIDDLTGEFRPIEGYPGYRASTFGRIQTCWTLGIHLCDESSWRDKKPFRMKGKHGKPRLTVMLYRGDGGQNFFVHRLILMTFVGPAPDGMQCCHNDGNAENNRLDNLRWDTPLANSADSIRHGAMRRGSQHGIAKLDEERVAEIKRLRRDGQFIKALAKQFDVSVGTVCNIVNGKVWKHVP